MKEYIAPEIKSYTPEEIREMTGPAESQYIKTINEDLPATGPTGTYYDEWHFDALAGTNITFTVTPAATLDASLSVLAVIPPPYLISANANGPGGIETGSTVIPSTGTWLLSVATCCGSGSGGSYTLTITSDRPLSNFVVVNDDLYI